MAGRGGGICVGETATEAGGTHPTKMYSSFVFIIMVQSKYVFIALRLLLAFEGLQQNDEVVYFQIMFPSQDKLNIVWYVV